MPDGLRSRLPAGLIDSGSASAASFLVGLAATWTLSPADLGVYAVFFSAFLTGSFLPRHLVLLPVEMLSVEHPRESRGGLVSQSLFISIWPALIGVLAIGLAALASVRISSPGLLWPITLTAAAATFLSPLQDHVRRMLHMADRSWNAAQVSLVQLVVVAVFLALFLLGPFESLDVDPGWLPFGALAVANLVTLVLGIALALRNSTAPGGDLTLRGLSEPGRWLLLSGVATKGGAFVAAAIISNLVGPDVLGYAEAARIAAQPLMVLGFGLGDVISPRLMEAAHAGDEPAGRKFEGIYLKIFWGMGLVYLAVSAFDWALNPMAWLVPPAYVVPGLVAVCVVANMVTSALYPFHAELVGGRFERRLARIDSASSVLPIVLAGTAGVTLSFARPLGVIAQAVYQMVAYRKATHAMYVSRMPVAVTADSST